MTQPGELTVENLETQLSRSMSCARTTVPGDQFRAIFALATRVKAFDVANFEHLDVALDGGWVNVTGREIRCLLMLALQAKRAGLPPRLRVVRKPKL